MPCRSGRSLALGCCLMLGVSLAAEPDAVKTDLAALKQAAIATDTSELLSFFKKRTLSEETRTKVAKLIEQLGASEYAAREKATNDLIDLGPLGRVQLSQATRSDDAEVRKRARLVLTKLGPAALESNLFAPAARVLASRKAAGAAKVLLDFLPCVENPDVADEVAAALSPLALTKAGKPDPTLLLALSDRFAAKRAAAAAALAKAAGAGVRPSLHKLLKDANAGVRRRVAVALVEAKDREAVPTLIALLSSSGEEAGAAEEVLLAIAGEKAPERPPSDTPAAPEVYRKRWLGWWEDHGSRVDLSKVDFAGAYRGYTLVATMNAVKTTSGQVAEYDGAGKLRWKIENLNYPVHAAMVRRDRVLICEYYGNKVTERDLKGNVIWTKQAGNQVLSARRLSNGNTFIVTRNQLVEVDRDGKEVRSISRPFDVLAAHRHKDGKYTLLTTNGNCLQLDSGGRQLNSFNVGYLGGVIGFRAHFLPSGGVVVPDYSRGKLREYDSAGKMVWEVDAYRPNVVVKMPNGNLLYASRLRNYYIELDRTGKEVARHDTDGRPMFIDRR